MKLSTKGRYATRVMLDLALHDTDVVTIADLAEKARRNQGEQVP